jgi:hypothetical protein
MTTLERLTYRAPGDDRMLAALRELNDADKRFEALKAEVERLNMEVSLLRVERDTARSAEKVGALETLPKTITLQIPDAWLTVIESNLNASLAEMEAGLGARIVELEAALAKSEAERIEAEKF